MASGLRPINAPSGMLRVLAAVLIGLAVFSVGLSGPAFAQDGFPQPDSGGQMLLEADTLTYDDDRGLVIAAGDVRIAYNGTKLVAQRVVFDRNSNRVMAFGNVQVIDTEGNVTFADEVDVTDDMSTGFVNALRIETSDKTYFASESAERQQGNITTFNHGVYTACEPCEENPDKAPIWRIKSKTIIWNKKKKTIRFVRPKMELFGKPIAFFPALEIPDHTVKRKSGFLFPTAKFGTGLGFGVGVPYYWALSPTYDLTTTLSGYTSQGFLGEAEWRQRFNNGEYSVKVAGIYQLRPSAFNAGTVDSTKRLRYMAGTKGRFRINPRWVFGWDVMFQSDKNFASTYGIQGYGESERRDEIYLTGLNGRNYMDLRVMRFQIQENSPTGRHEVQPWVLPLLDYSYTPDRPVAGGELNIDINAQHLRRNTLLTVPTSIITGTNIPGVQGNMTRLTAEAEWKRNIIAPGGLVLTPILHVRGDAIFQNLSAASVAAINSVTIGGVPVPVDLRSSYVRYMATAGLEARWPLLFATQNSSHVIEPVAQIFARPNEQFATTLGIANEDAQSMVFDATTLFERDKFSGRDRMEGGIRANLGVRYSGIFANGWTANAIIGQSFHIAGLNSYGTPDLVNAGAFSGLETARSDYVGMVGLMAPNGTKASVSARLDETTLNLRRIDVRANANVGGVSVGGMYSFIQAQPLYGYAVNRHQITANASARITEFWSVSGSLTWDFVNRRVLTNSVAISYQDECFTFALLAAQTRNTNGGATQTSIGLTMSFRTVGDISTGQLSGN